MAGAMHALTVYKNVKRIAIIDLDVHHGNGTEEMVKRYVKEANVHDNIC